MPRVVATHIVSPADAERLLAPRDDFVLERPVDDGRFEAVDGPFAVYERVVEREPAGDGQILVTERIDFRVAAPFWRSLVELPFRRALRWWPRPRRWPWWHPPDRFDRRAASVLALLCSIAIIGGYLGTLITQTITFAADEFGATRTDQGTVLAVTRIGVLVAVLLGALADRRGRRRLLGVSAAAGCVLAATGALAPNLAWLGVSQTVARGFATALLLLVGIVSAEEMPPNSRAWAVSLIAMTGALGAGVCVWLLPLADLGPATWRILYVVPLAGLLLVAWVVRRLPESRRFSRPHAEVVMTGHGRRFWLLAVSGYLLAVFAAPATQFQNEFLRDERGFSAALVTLFILCTATPGGLGIIVGGRLADVRGRRLVGAIGIVGGTLATVAMFNSAGALMWLASVTGSIVAGLVVPALGVYRPELFPTSLRGRAAGIIELIALAGSGTGLIVVGRLADRWGDFGGAFGLMAAAPLVVAALVLALYPETAHHTLEELNPEDQEGG
ncbi:MAG: MFS transporter [Acidimicrobiales bacterium]